MRAIAVTLLCAAAALAFAQSSSPRQWQAPAEASAKQNPYHGKAELAAGGQKIFTKTCAKCHDPGEKQKGPNLASSEVQQESDGALFWKISNGNSRSGMPNFSNLPDGQRWQLVLYIRSLAQPSKQ
jgi:mono/diheme cytochrome c family protein